MSKNPQNVTVERWTKWLSQPPKAPQLVMVTPELAERAIAYHREMVGANGHKLQRPLSQYHANWLAHVISAGKFRTTHQGVAFDSEGRVQDGQHRLHAIIKSKTAVPLWVFFGADPDLFPDIDQGLKVRGPADMYAMEEVPNYKDASSVVRQYVILESRGHRGMSTGFAPRRTLRDWYESYLDIGPERVQRAVLLKKRLYKAHMPYTSVLAAMHIRATELDLELAEQFFDKLVTGADLGPRAIEKKLRDHLLLTQNTQKQSKVVADVIRAWNARRQGKRSFSLAEVTTMPEMV